MPIPIRLDIYQTSIPMRGFEHAAAAREVAQAIVTRMEFDNGQVAWGETLPRDYVTGETLQSVPEDIATIHWPLVAGRDFDEASLADLLPETHHGRCVTAAACAVELPLASLFSLPSSLLAARIPSRVSGVLGSRDPERTAKRLRLMRWFGLRDFKLKLGLGDDVDAENLRIVCRKIGRAVAAGKCTLRVDVNGAWDAASVPQRVAALEPLGVCVVEQPTFCSAAELAELAKRCSLPLMADESLRTSDDATALLAAGDKVWWNIRISKNGGLTKALALARRAAGAGIPYVIGAMVGESSILSAAQRRLLQCIASDSSESSADASDRAATVRERTDDAPSGRSVGPLAHARGSDNPPATEVLPRFVEGNYGRFLLADDLTDHSLRFGYGGKLKSLPGLGLGVTMDHDKLQQYGKLLRTLQF